MVSEDYPRGEWFEVSELPDGQVVSAREIHVPPDDWWKNGVEIIRDGQPRPDVEEREVSEFKYRLSAAPLITAAQAEAIARETLARLRGYTVPDPIRDDAERCENCGALVTVIVVKREGISDKPRLMELLPKDDDDPFMNKMETHTPERCRMLRSGR